MGVASVLWGIASVQWRLLNTVGDNISTCRVITSVLWGDNISTVEGHLQYCEGGGGITAVHVGG